jgi:hypothetical protein
MKRQLPGWITLVIGVTVAVNAATVTQQTGSGGNVPGSGPTTCVQLRG